MARYPWRNKQVLLARLLPITAIYVLLLLPAIAANLYSGNDITPDLLFVRVLVAIAVFTLPLMLFCKNLKLYLYLLLIWVLLAPLLIFFAIWLRVSLDFTFVALLLQTNPAEIEEATHGYRLFFALVEVSYVLVYLFAVRKNKLVRLSFKPALYVFVAAFLVFTSFVLVRRYHDRYKTDEILNEIYPLSLFNGLYEAHKFKAKNNLDASKNFFFHAYRKDTSRSRRVFVFIIGESSRYDHWGVNGYNKPTSPLLNKENHLITFSNVTSGCNLTWMSVPQMITRANPDNIDAQFKEKSILAAFDDAGYKTVWLSNQSDQEVFWSGTITLHAKTADVSLFQFPNAKNIGGAFGYDARMLPSFDSLLHADSSDLFCVLHTYGNHWTYPDRYPAAFEVFKPAGKSEDQNPFSASGHAAISNAYDNSIRYADYFIDSVIHMVDKVQAISTVTFLSDHGEDIFDASPSKMYFHLSPSIATLHVPLFVWTSDRFRQTYADKVELLAAHRDQKIGPENTFFTLLDLANVSFPGFDSTRSIAAPAFHESNQRYYYNRFNHAYDYSGLKP